MQKTWLIALLLVFAGTGLAQDDETTDPAEPEAAAETPADESADEAADEAEADEVVDVDDESYLDIDDDDFRPTEEIPTDQSITFPTDI